MNGFIIERSPDNFEFVRAERVDFISGSTVFTDADGGFHSAYANGQWLTVVLDEDDA